MLEVLEGGREETLHGVNGCFVVWKNMPRLKKYANLGSISEHEIDKWLVSEFSFISSPYRRKNKVTKKIRTNK